MILLSSLDVGLNTMTQDDNFIISIVKSVFLLILLLLIVGVMRWR